MQIVGYTDPWSVAPGEELRVMVSSRSPSFQATLRQLTGGGGDTAIASAIDGEHPGHEQPLHPGSHAVVEQAPPLEPGAGFTLEAWVWPTAPGGAVQVIAGRHDGSRGYALGLDESGRATLWLDGDALAVDRPLLARSWYRLEATFDVARGRARVGQTPLRPWPGAVEAASVERDSSGWSATDAPFLLAARGEPATAHYNGKLEAPRLLAADGVELAAWNLGGDHASDHLADASGGGRHARCVNLPMRAVTGRAWRGETTDADAAPEEYAAIWFHDDDLEDARWEPAFTLTVPEGLASGVYAIQLQAAEAGDDVPFVVRPPRGRPASNVVVLLPTLSYLAYANEHASWMHPIPATPGLDRILACVSVRDRYMADNRLLSIYERHTDGSGVAYSSRRRPVVNLRHDLGMPLLQGGPHQFPADMELLRWLDGLGIAYDVVTDEDLHHEGAAVLEGYCVLLTGSHPEYWSGAMLDALESWQDGGGRLMYLGGNGFYWVTSVFADRPHVLEVRRGHAGTGVWRSDPGEVHHASTGEPGGLWRFRGRPPQRVAGVGFTAQGFDASLPYRLTDAARDPRAAWIFEGVEGEEIGAHGSVLGGAGGFEIDRVDPLLGTPPHALVLAVSRGFSDVYQATTEDILTSDSQQGGTVSPLVRADLVYYERPNGGAVFSTGSIAWCGALLTNGSDNDVSRITANVLRRFAAEGPVGG